MQKTQKIKTQKFASKEKLEKLRQDGLLRLKKPKIREVFLRLKDK